MLLVLKTTHFATAPCFSFNPKRNAASCSLRIVPRCSLSTLDDATHLELKNSNNKPLPAEVSRTIMELSKVGTLSTLTREGWPLGIGVRFGVDSEEGTPFFKFNNISSTIPFSLHSPSSTLHVQLNQSGLRTPQCTLQGTLTKPQDTFTIKRLASLWNKRFGEQIDQEFIYTVTVDRVLQLEDFQEDGVWVTSSDYKNAQPDPLREFADKLVNEINSNNMEDLTRFCNVYVDLDFQVSEAKLIWVDRLGFDMRLSSPQKGIFEVRIPFPREVTDEKGAKSTFNCMSQLAWEVERNFHPPDFQKVKQLKPVKS
ncbi:hypothetical protein RIF29_28433 [Crotalaria pallida]|uniref:DUF2470 domain-containing protein n=1 Tax=Crotalaria pallida TaxID=3830 RepID=A0AAN9EF08_CROPI